jgi:hypothetical protein
MNGDGSPDIYVCNDFQTVDRFWVNDGHGKFRALPRIALRKESYSAMGVDFADIDRDGCLDFFVTEMLSRDHSMQMRQSPTSSPPPPSPAKSRIDPECCETCSFTTAVTTPTPKSRTTAA